MYEYSVVHVCVPGRGRGRKWRYHELRLVRKLIGGGHYERSAGCTIIQRSGPVRSSKRLEAEYSKRCAELNAALAEQQQREAAAAVARYCASYALSALPPAVAGHTHLALPR